MCIAIVKTKDSTISDDVLRNCFENNPDGAGVAYTKDGELYIVKGIFDVNNFIKIVRETERIADSNILIHCRIGTSGLKDKDNTHPHVVNSKTVLIHNGILNIDVPKDSKKSDTVLFIERYLKDLDDDFIYNKPILKLIQDLIGTNNKFCFLNSNGDYAILNEDKGFWIDGVWYSNYSFEDYTKYSYVNSKYYFDDIDNEYLDAYGLSRDEFLDEYTIDTYTKNRIKDFINNLDDDDLLELGNTPIYNVDTTVIRGDDDNLELNEFYLYELDDELQDLYDYKYYCYDYNQEVIDSYV